MTLDGGADLYEMALRDAQATALAGSRSGGVTARDLLVLLKIAAAGPQRRFSDVARELGVRASEASVSLERCRRVGLIDGEKRRVLRGSLLEFLEHGTRFVFPAEIGATARGVATAELAGRYVWASVEGESWGSAVTPLDPLAPGAAAIDERLRELLRLVDALRLGGAGERRIAARDLGRRLGP